MRVQKTFKPKAAVPPVKFDLKQFEQDLLAEHNRLRSLHGCPPLKLNNNLSIYATEWAKKLSQQTKLEHRTEGKYGENIFMASGQEVDGKMAVINWYDEISKYNFDKPGFNPGIGHFTQVVWKGSKELGVGVEKKNNSTWVVVNYNPPGNYLNEFAENVPKPLTNR